jgi:hypothetical protein
VQLVDQLAQFEVVQLVRIGGEWIGFVDNG